MQNPTYDGGFQHCPMPERIAYMRFLKVGEEPSKEAALPTKMMSIGIKTITHDRSGLKLIPHKVVVVEMSEGDEVGSFDLSSGHARQLAGRLIEFAESIENEGVKS
jgi:hypothetical protein